MTARLLVEREKVLTVLGSSCRIDYRLRVLKFVSLHFEALMFVEDFITDWGGSVAARVGLWGIFPPLPPASINVMPYRPHSSSSECFLPCFSERVRTAAKQRWLVTPTFDPNFLFSTSWDV